MARLWSDGAELQTATAGVIWTAVVTAAPAIETSIKRSGNAAYRINNTGGAEGFRIAHSSAQGDFYMRFYLYVVAAPTATKIIGGFGLNGSYKGAIQINPDLTLELYNAEDNAQIGSDSSALSLNTWYRIELKQDSTTLSSTAVDARIDGVSFASGTYDLSVTCTNVRFVMNAADATLDYVIDDLAINDTAGSFENTWCGEGEVICLRPNGNGDASDWGGSDGNSTDNYLLLDEVPPDATDYVQDDTLNQIDEWEMEATPAALESTDVINVVHVGVYAAVSDAASADPDIVLRIKSASGGTVEESAALDVNSVTFQGPAPLPSNNNYQLTLYDLPGASTTAWTKTELDTMQIGVRVSTTDAHLARVGAAWVMIDHKPGVGGAASILPLVAVDMANISDIGGMRG